MTRWIMFRITNVNSNMKKFGFHNLEKNYPHQKNFQIFGTRPLQYDVILAPKIY